MRANDDVEITPYPDGPLLVRGPVRVFDEDGTEIELTRRTIAICRCGRSRIHPFCDGTHKKTLDEKEGTLCWYDADVVRHELTGAFPNIRTPSE